MPTLNIGNIFQNFSIIIVIFKCKKKNKIEKRERLEYPSTMGQFQYV